jgi:hypothetical protein
MDDIIAKLKSEYDYLKDIPLEGCLWEFIRRNKARKPRNTSIVRRPIHMGYVDIYNELKKQFPKTEIIVSKEHAIFSPSEWVMNIHSTSETVNENLQILESKFGIKPIVLNEDDSDCYLTKQVKESDDFIGIPNPNKKYWQMKPPPTIKGANPVAITTFRGQSLSTLKDDKLHQYCHTLIEKISVAGKQNTLYVGIPLNARKDEVRQELEKIVTTKISEASEDVNKKFGKWMFYLIYYDLFELMNSKAEEDSLRGRETFKKDIHKNIADIVNDAYPNMHINIRDVDYGIYKASNLIRDGFKKFLYIPKID